jgi:hypothetical protein
MTMRGLFTTIALGVAGLATTPVHAQSWDPCTVYMCMAGISGFGASGGPACAPALAYWHAPTPAGLAVYDVWTGFDAPASAARRMAYMDSCPTITVNPAVVSAIIALHGSIP